jgi:predicted HD superfamily hydrolase involved in NAD metabolism
MSALMTVYDLALARERLKHLPPDLLAHCERVREVCLALARRWGASLEKAEFVALTHDVARALGLGELLSLARSYKLLHDEVELRHPVLLHGPVGAEILRQQWGIDDEEVLGAVACHTVGRAEMTLLEKILFLADKIEPEKSRERPGPARIKELTSVDLDRAVLELLDQLLLFHVENKHLIHPSSLAARNSLLVKVGRNR